jgi:hypothetical protein
MSDSVGGAHPGSMASSALPVFGIRCRRAGLNRTVLLRLQRRSKLRFAGVNAGFRLGAAGRVQAADVSGRRKPTFGAGSAGRQLHSGAALDPPHEGRWDTRRPPGAMTGSSADERWQSTSNRLHCLDVAALKQPDRKEPIVGSSNGAQ